jgi:hypothetical protein
MGLNIFGKKEKSKSTTNPWAKQAPFLETGFNTAQDLMNLTMGDNSWQGIQGLMQQYGEQLMPGLGQAQSMFGNLMADPGNAQYNPYAAGHQGYNDITQNYWTQPYEMAGQQLQADLMENFRRSDAGDAMGASLAGQGVGPRSTEYLQARALGLGETQNALSRGMVGLHQDAMGTAVNRANNYAGSFLGNQGAALDGMWQSGMAGAGMLPQAYAFGQEAQWSPLRNYWDIVGAANWGGSTKSKGSSFGFDANIK